MPFQDVFPQLSAFVGTDNRTGTSGSRCVTSPQCRQAKFLFRHWVQRTVQQSDLLPAGSDMRRLLLVVPRATNSVLLQKVVLHDRLLPWMLRRAAADGRDRNVEAVHQGAKRCGSKHVISSHKKRKSSSSSAAAALRKRKQVIYFARDNHTPRQPRGGWLAEIYAQKCLTTTQYIKLHSRRSGICPSTK